MNYTSPFWNIEMFIGWKFQDYRIAERIEREGKGCLIVVNKWDTIPNKNQQTATYYEQDVRDKLRLLSWAPIVYSTAIAGHSVDKYDSIFTILVRVSGVLGIFGNFWVVWSKNYGLQNGVKLPTWRLLVLTELSLNK